MKVNKFENISSKAIYKGPGIELHNFCNAMELINLCEETKIPVLGIDAFFILDGKIQPSLEHSIDISSEERCYNLAKKFLQNRKEMALVYEIVY